MALTRGNIRSRAVLQLDPNARGGTNEEPNSGAPVLLTTSGGAGNP
jgi:hypothetical protein